MSEWGVVEVLIALMGLIAIVVGAVVYIVSSLTKVSEINAHLKEELTNDRAVNIEAHKKLWDRIDKQDDKIAEHDKEIYGIKMMLDAEPD